MHGKAVGAELQGSGATGKTHGRRRWRSWRSKRERAGLASSTEIDESDVQKQLGHTPAGQTRWYQRRSKRFRVNLTRASGLWGTPILML